MLVWRCGCSLDVQWGTLTSTRGSGSYSACCCTGLSVQNSDCSREACLLPGLALFSPAGFLLSNLLVKGELALNFRLVVTHLLCWSLKMLGRVKMLSPLLIYQETTETGLLKSGQTLANCFMQVTPTLIYQLSEALESLIFTISQKNTCWIFLIM